MAHPCCLSLPPWSLQGKYSFKLLAVDVPSAVDRQQRIFLEGDEKGYSRGGIMGELRDPFIRVSPLCIAVMALVLAASW